MLIIRPPPGVTLLLPTGHTWRTSAHRHSGAEPVQSQRGTLRIIIIVVVAVVVVVFKASLGYLSRSYLKSINHLWCLRKYQQAWSSLLSVFFLPGLLAIGSLFPSSLSPTGAETAALLSAY